MKFILLSQQNYKPRQQFPHMYDPEAVRAALSFIPDSEVPHIDLETTGLDERSDHIVCIGIAFSKGHFCIDTRAFETLSVVIEWLWARKSTYGAFNSSFDSLFISTAMQRQFPDRKLYEYTDKMSEDSYVSFKMLANEDNTPRNLDIAIKHVLGWPEACYQKDWLKEALATHELSKNDMCKLMDLEHDDFMTYCSLDAEASYQLESYTRGFIEAANFDALAKVKKLYIQDIRLAVEAQMHGLAIDITKLRAYKMELDVQVDEALKQFAEHPKVAPCIKHYNEVVYEAYHRPVVTTKTIWAKKVDQAHLNPEVWTKKLRNKPAKWEAEHGSWFRIEYNSRPPKRKAEPSWFNPGSDTDLLWLFYGKAKNSTGQEPWAGLVDYKVTRQPDPENEKSWERYGIVEAYFEDGKSLTWSMTSGGELPIDQDFRGMFGEPGKLLNAWVTLQGRQADVDKLVEAAGDEGRIYPGKRVMSTVTGRSGSSGKVGMLTLMKVRRYMECFVPDPGYTFLQTDFSSLEDVILAELSQDPTMLEIYASGKPHDGYLAFAAMYDPRKDEIQKLYNVQNPTKEGVAEAKKVFKPIRKAWKLVKLSRNYGAGVVKIQRNMAAKEDLWLTLPETKDVLDAYTEAVKVTEEYKQTIVSEWQQRNGWIMNSLGRPMCVPDTYVKDLCSRRVQSTGRDILSLLEFFIHYIRVRDGIDLIPVSECHDDVLYQIANDQIEQGRACFREAVASVNRILNWSVELKAPEEIGDNLNVFKDGSE